MKEILEAITALLSKRERIIAAIDGRCAAGKTTLAHALQGELSCNVFHMDDFFLRPEQRTQERLNTPGGNVDYERFLKEVLLPIKSGGAASFRPYSCKTGELGAELTLAENAVNIVEGSYACHPALWEHYDLHIFLDVDPDEQLRRIEKRNGKEAAQRFKALWIPLEEKYFSAFEIAEKCELKLSADVF